MPRFFVKQEQINDGYVKIYGEDAHHISRSLRMAAGEKITVCDMQSYEYECELCEFAPEYVSARVLSSRKSETEPPFYAHLYQALPKGEKLDQIIQKAVECGVSEVTPFESERCIVKAKDSSEDRKAERRQKIAFEAAKQSGRGIIPKVNMTLSYKSAVLDAAKADVAIFCYEGTGTEPLGKIIKTAALKYKSEIGAGTIPVISIMIGSEGGFSQDEAEFAKSCGMILSGLGRRILRTETASGFVLASIVCEFELDP